MDIQEVCRALNATENQIRYWKKLLKKQGLLRTTFSGRKEVFTSEDFQKLKALSEHVSKGLAATQAVRLIADGEGPGSVTANPSKGRTFPLRPLKRHLLQLRSPRWLRRLMAWIRRLLRRPPKPNRA